MSKLAVAAACGLTLTGMTLLAISQMDFTNLLSETTEQRKTRIAKEALRTWCLIGGVAVIGAAVALKTSHSDLGKGMMLGSGTVLGIGLLTTAAAVNTLPASPEKKV